MSMEHITNNAQGLSENPIKWSDLTYEAMPETKFNKLYNIYST